MNKTISIIRLAVLLTLGTIAMIFLFGEEQDQSLPAFLVHVAVDKTLALALCYSIARLYKRWSKTDPWLMAYNRMCDRVAKEPGAVCSDNRKKN